MRYSEDWGWPTSSAISINVKESSSDNASMTSKAVSTEWMA